MRSSLVFGARHLRALCSTGVAVSFQGTSSYADGVPVKGLFDRPVQMKFQEGGTGGVETACPELRLPFNAFNPMPQSGDELLVGGTGYKVNQPTAEDDGAFLVYELYEIE
jgi:hypothetical protein